MIYVEYFADGDPAGVEAIEDPIWIKYHERNRRIIECPRFEAIGVVSSDGSKIFMLNGNELSGVVEETIDAVIISQSEYEEYIATHPEEDPEDEDPEIPEDPGDEILSRAELTAAVRELQAQNEMLEECLLEMSEIVYE
ncbi:MAG: hypothetical protein IJS45_07495 [Clostridia bacterium]|nr:hypothetical protein [Clostridia bacterium]